MACGCSLFAISGSCRFLGCLVTRRQGHGIRSIRTACVAAALFYARILIIAGITRASYYSSSRIRAIFQNNIPGGRVSPAPNRLNRCAFVCNSSKTTYINETSRFCVYNRRNLNWTTFQTTVLNNKTLFRRRISILNHRLSLLISAFIKLNEPH